MKRFSKVESSSVFQTFKTSISSSRDVSALGASNPTGCLNCPDKPCITFYKTGEMTEKVAVCPTSAISVIEGEKVYVNDDCISCGICAALCPAAAIDVVPGTKAVVRAIQVSDLEIIEDVDVYYERREALRRLNFLTPVEINSAVSAFSKQSESLTQKSFYRLVATLFECLDINTFLPPSGDTNNRVDLFLIDEVSSLAIEIKSATETKSINIKSVQQALENRIVLDERRFFNALPDDSSLVVGFEYPNERSGVTELILDIHKTFGVRIGMISIEELYRRVFSYLLRGESFDRSILTKLIGELR